MQKILYAHPFPKTKLNNVFNANYYDMLSWDLFPQASKDLR